MADENREVLLTTVNLGDFPFPLTKGPEESRYLTWLRNHSNYMATRGFLDYLRAVGVLVRGVLINFLILMSLLLMVSLVVGYLYRTELLSKDAPSTAQARVAIASESSPTAVANRSLYDWVISPEMPEPFALTFRVPVLALVWIVFSPILTRFGQISGQKKSMERAGSDSSVKRRDQFERTFGFALLLILAVALFEALPALVYKFHQFHGYRNNTSTDWNTIFMWLAGVSVAVMGGAGKLLSLLGGATRKLAMLLIGLLGLLVPLLVILHVTEFLVFGPPASLEIWGYSLILPLLGTVVIPIAILLSLKGGVTLKERLRLSGLFVVFVMLFLAVSLAWGFGFLWSLRYQTETGSQSRKLVKLAYGLAKLHGDEGVNPASKSAKLQAELAYLADRFLKVPEEDRWRGASEFAALLEQKLDKWPDQRGKLLVGPVVLDEVERLKAVLERLASTTQLKELAEPKQEDDKSSVKRKSLADEFHKLPRPDRLGLDQTDELELSYLADCTSGDNSWGPFYSQDPFYAWYPIDKQQLEQPEIKLELGSSPNNGKPNEPDYSWHPFEKRKPSELAEEFIRGLQDAGSKLKGAQTSEQARLVFGPLADLSPGKLTQPYYAQAHHAQYSKALLILVLAFELWLYCRLAVNVNRTSLHGLYRDRLASAYLVGLDTRGDVDIEQDIKLGEICCHEAGSTAPYHLVNVALNLQGSKDISIRDRNSDFFIFSKRFIGGPRTGYCRTGTLEQVHPELDLATAMAISAAAASPNMGRGTNPALVPFMVLINIRLGYWLPNPGLLEEELAGRSLKRIRTEGKAMKGAPGFPFEEVFEQELVEVKRRWDNVYRNPSEQRRLHMTNGRPSTIPTTAHGLVGIGFSGGGIRSATINLGIAQVLHEYGVFDHVDYMSTVSGGGYLGSSISALMRCRTKPVSEVTGKLSVSVNGTGEKIVRVSRSKPEVREYRYPNGSVLDVRDGDRVKAGQRLIKGPGSQIQSEIEGVVSLDRNARGENIVRVSDQEREYRYSNYAELDEGARPNAQVEAGQRLVRPSGPRARSEIAGNVRVETKEDTGEKIVTVTGGSAPPGFLARVLAWVTRSEARRVSEPGETREYRYAKYDAAVVAVKDRGVVKAGGALIYRHNSLWDRFRWRVRPWALVREMMMKLDETYKWINLSDGGHIENLAGIELLRRRCKFIIIGDGEADPDLGFDGLATLIRYARIDLGTGIDIHPVSIRLDKSKDAVDKGTEKLSREHLAIGKITYPPDEDHGYKKEYGLLLYLKSSFSGDEDELIQGYRHRNPDFPHQTTADQFFDEDQFESYRGLGQHIGEMAFEHAPAPRAGKMSFAELERWLETLANPANQRKKGGEVRTGSPSDDLSDIASDKPIS